MSEIKQALQAARDIVDACAGDNRPATGWAAKVRTQIDAALSSAAVAGGEEVDDLKPRYTTKRLRQEIERARENDTCRIAALEAQLAERVKVKALEWVEIAEGPRCITLCGTYAIHPSAGAYGRPTLSLTGMPGDLFGKFDTIEAAKAAAQADYERRIRSALKATSPAPMVTEEGTYRAWRIRKGEPIPRWLEATDGIDLKAADDLIVIEAEEGFDVYLSNPNSNQPMMIGLPHEKGGKATIVGAPTNLKVRFRPYSKVPDNQADLIRRIVLPMVGERSREVGDAWDKAYHILDALTAAQEAGKP